MCTSSDDPLSKALARASELEGELEACRRSAKFASQELQDFVYAASHDLQEPLRTILAYSQLLERMYEKDEQARELTAFIAGGVDRMRGLIEKLVIYSRVNPSPILQNLKLDAAIQAALFKLSGVIQESQAVVRFDSLPEIAAHDLQMSQVFEQILSNAILYRGALTPEIHITAEEGEVDGEAAQIVKVKDNGVGIEAQYLSQVLQPFKRLHSKEFPGNGLGLAICDRIMRAHNGKLWLESNGSGGTTVHLAFPF